MTRASTLSAQRLFELSRKKGSATARISFGPIDLTRPFVPEHFTHLYYTDCYPSLSREQRIRYNQLFGLRVNETFMMFEGGFANVVMKKLSGDSRLVQHPFLRSCLLQMIEEEEHHCRMFLALNRLCLPEIYEKQDNYFTNLRWFQSALLNLLKVLPQTLTFLIWVILFSEEWSKNFSKAIIRGLHTESLGDIESNFVKAHRAHLADEARHVEVDVELIRSLLQTMPKWKRAMDAWLVRTFVRKMVIPKRSGIAVVRHLVGEFPCLAAMEQNMVRGITSLGAQPRFLTSFYDPKAVPRTFFLFEKLPEFRYLD